MFVLFLTVWAFRVYFLLMFYVLSCKILIHSMDKSQCTYAVWCGGLLRCGLARCAYVGTPIGARVAFGFRHFGFFLAGDLFNSVRISLIILLGW